MQPSGSAGSSLRCAAFLLALSARRPVGGSAGTSAACRCSSAPSGPEEVRDDRDVDVRHVAERLGDGVGRAVVQEAVPEAPVLALREQDGDLGLGLCERLGDELGRGAGDAPVGALDDVEREPVEPELLPRADEVFGADRVEVEVDGPELVGRERARVLDGARRREVEVLDEDHHGVAAQRVRFGGAWRVGLELVLFGFVLPVQAHEQRDQHGHEDDDDPRAPLELGDADDDRRRRTTGTRRCR